MATALHWFNPVVYLMAKAVNVLCETSCDAEVLRSADTDTRQIYGETIIGVVQYQSKLKTALSTNFYGGKKSKKTRISSIMDTRKKKAGAIITALVLTFALGTGLVLASTPVQASDPPDAYLDEPAVVGYEEAIDEPTRLELPDDADRIRVIAHGCPDNRLALAGVSRDAEFMFTEEEWAYILERIDAGLTWWID